MNIDLLIQTLILDNRRATDIETQQIITYVAQRPFASYPTRLTRWLRQELMTHGINISQDKQPSVEIHLLKRIYFDGQWSIGTTAEQFEADLHQSVQHPAVQIWTYRRLGEHYVGFLAPSHVHDAPHLKPFIFVAYSADYGTITTGFQASGANTIFTDAFEQLVQHR